MDGGGRLLRSIGVLGTPVAPAPFSFGFKHPITTAAGARLRKARRYKAKSLLQYVATSNYFGSLIATLFLGGVVGSALVQSGRYAEFVTQNGTIQDVVARNLGFSINTISLNGSRDLSQGEILGYAGITDRDSLLFLDVAKVRQRLKAVPLVKEAAVTKLFPHRLQIDIEERKPFALWQKDGIVSVIAADGATLDLLRDPRFEHLPLVVGDDANKGVTDYLAILDAAGSLRDQIRAGMFVAGRRWTLKLVNGVEVALPEIHPEEAMERLVTLERESHVLERDILSLDMRIPNRVIAALSVEAASARADALAKKSKKKDAAT